MKFDRKTNPERYSDRISLQLRRKQGELGLSAAKISRECGLSIPTVASILDGYLNASVYNLKLVADVLQVKMKELF